ncbi:MAG: AMP-binding protein [Acidimicrobiia bacterium]|nr:AMP-binding protein [Acidimicrobiia bacterium]
MGESRASGPTITPLLDETIGSNLRRMATVHADREALVSVGQSTRHTYREFDEAVDHLTSGLLAAGLSPGDRAGIWSPNRAEWVLLQYATARIGVILVTVNPAYRTSELEYCLRHSGCRVVVAAPSFKTSDYREMLATVAPKIDSLERVVFLDDPEWGRLAKSDIDRRSIDAVADRLLPDDPINIQYTSGTTGTPKGATLSHRNILNNGFFVGERCRYTPEDRVCIPVPFYHCFGMVLGNLACTTHGATMVIPGEAFEPEAVLDTVEKERCTSLYGVPTMFIAELAHPGIADRDLTSLRTGIMAGAPCPVEVMKRVVDTMCMSQVTIAYGMTETSPVSTQTSTDDELERRISTVGTVHPHVEIKIIDDHGTTLPTDTPGELCTRGYSVMLGYWDDPDRTAEVIDAEGWMHSGDLAVMDESGYVRIVGRKKDMIIRGGENISPREIEEFLIRHDGVLDAQVVGVPDERFGEAVVAFIRRTDPALTETEVREFCRGQIAHFKIPRDVVFVDEFPMTVTGKVQKYRLREMAASQTGGGPA